jgi:hypothetical protein
MAYSLYLLKTNYTESSIRMKYQLSLLLLFFFQTTLFSQTPNFIDIKIEEKNFQGQKNPNSTCELKFDTSGKLLKRIGYQITMLPNRLPCDLIETYTYTEEGLLKIILVQAKDSSNILKTRFQSKCFYNDKKQLVEMINFNYIFDSIQQKFSFEYDRNGNRIRINKDTSEYIIARYNKKNKSIKSEFFKNKNFIKEVNIYNDTLFTYRDLPNLQPNRIFIQESNVPYLVSRETPKTRCRTQYAYHKNGIIKSIKELVSYDNSYPSIEFSFYKIVCDEKTKHEKSIIKKINKEIIQNNNWQ